MRNMAKRKLSLTEALKLLKENKLGNGYLIEFIDSDRIEATNAIKLGALGIDVPEESIYYDDDNIVDDDEFDGEWTPIDSDIEHYKTTSPFN